MTLNCVWKNGKIINPDDAKIGITTHSLHYGSGVFEGIRAYNTSSGTAILMLEAHMKRFLYSMNAIGMKSKFTLEELCQAVKDTVKASGLDSCYIRPFAYFAEGGVSVLPSDDHPVDIVIYCLPMGRYLAAEFIDIKVSKYIRIHPQSTVADAKISGHYVNSILASRECVGTHYHESLLLDYNGNVAEGAAMNIFIVKDGEIITTPLGTILDGITRKLVIMLAKDYGYKVREEYFKVEDIINADEAFFCGTAAEITPVRSIDDHKLKNHQSVGPITKSLKDKFEEIKQGKAYKNTLTYIN
ncbi:branched-chain amino acid transaminase [Francisella frigiditurris]|uniref:Branched-chain-amino-acid aminotransferase n=1 Tax=Francisella frigiditurris TaxID=1542390 RepID=A0A1J0KTQ3_9GAMM|nr:branched-chain amino acid transaminase [Francisella frigiditurris]APC97067.1 branched-chain amino acid aminotransferase [Francisella frigiditurris]